jgi:hypothetical protein
MPAITDPKVIKFMNEEVRPICEAMQALEARVNAVSTRYVEQVLPVVAGNVDGDIIDDNRLPEGISQYTKLDLTRWAAIVSGLRTELQKANVAETIDKGAVNPVRLG